MTVAPKPEKKAFLDCASTVEAIAANNEFLRRRYDNVGVRENMKTPSLSHKAISRNWFLVDASEATVGRAATQIASILRGKTNPFFTPHLDAGDFVVVVNAEKVRLTGKKEEGKVYWRYTGFPGGERATIAAEQRAQNPERILFYAVKGMLPKGPLGRRILQKLKVYSGPNHPHLAQQPKSITLR